VGPGHSAGLQATSPRALPGQHPIREENQDRELLLLSLANGNRSDLEEKGVPAMGQGQAGWMGSRDDRSSLSQLPARFPGFFGKGESRVCRA